MPGGLRSYPRTWASDIQVDARDLSKTSLDNTVGTIPFIHRIGINDAAGDVDLVLPQGERVIDVWFVKTTGAGAAGNTITVKNSGDAITNALDCNVASGVVVRAGSISSTYHSIAKGGTLRATVAKSGGNAAGILYVSAMGT